MLHRDISPDALVMGRRPDGAPYCRLTGFGLAKHLGDDDDDPTAITMTGQVVGNPRYMAPETILMGTLDPRTDLYALGVTLYELAAGRRPFAGDSLADMLKAHVQGTPDPLRQHRPDAPAELVGLLERLLHKDPEARFQSADDALQGLRSGATAEAATVASRGAEKGGAAKVVVGAAVAFAVVGAALWWLFASG